MTEFRGLAVALAVVAVALAAGTVAAAADAQVIHDGEELTLANGPNQTIHGTSSLPAGSTVELQLRSTSGSPFLLTPNATVTENGSFAATADLSNAESGTTFELAVVHDGETLTETTGTVVACDGDCETPSGTTTADADGTTLVYDGDRPTVAAGPGQTFEGRTSLDPGTVLRVRVQSTDPESIFLRTTSATVTPSGTFETEPMDFADTAPGTTFEVVVLDESTELLRTTGEVVPCGEAGGDACQRTPTPDGPDDWDSYVEVVATDSVGVSSIAEGTTGDTVPIQVSVGDRETVAVSIGGPSVNYVLNATVTDGNGDRKVRLRFNTSAAGHDRAPTLTAADDSDAVTVTDETRLDSMVRPLDPAEYPLAVYNGSAVSAPKAAVGTLVLHESSGSDDGGAASGGTDDTHEKFGFDETIVQASGGQRTTLTVSLAGSNASRLEIGSAESGLRVNATLRDGNGDGTVTVLFDTTAIGDRGTPTLAATDDADDVVVTDEFLASPPLSAGDYDLALYRGTNASGSPDDVGTLAVSESLATSDSSAPSDTGSGSTSSLLGGGALLAGGLLAVLGVGLLLGLVGR